MPNLNVKILKKIRRYGKLRFSNDSRYKEDVLFRIYEHAGFSKRKLLEQEMDYYFECINSGKIKPGESILKLSLSETKAG